MMRAHRGRLWMRRWLLRVRLRWWMTPHLIGLPGVESVRRMLRRRRVLVGIVRRTILRCMLLQLRRHLMARWRWRMRAWPWRWKWIGGDRTWEMLRKHGSRVGVHKGIGWQVLRLAHYGARFDLLTRSLHRALVWTIPRLFV